MTISATTQGLRPGVCTSTSRPSTPFDGQVIYETDTDKALVWNGTAWVYLSTASANPIGLHTCIPTSSAVTGAGSSSSVGANGKVTFSTAATVSINGCFSSSYTNYYVVCDLAYSTTGVNGQIRMRASGTDNTTANSYVRQQLYATSTTVGASRSTANEWSAMFSGSSGYTAGFTAVFYRPFAADYTACQTTVMDSQSGAQVDVCTGTHNQTTSYDGFSIYPNSGTISGSITVYGYFG